jgi:hypothetical protein
MKRNKTGLAAFQKVATTWTTQRWSTTDRYRKSWLSGNVCVFPSGKVRYQITSVEAQQQALSLNNKP